MPITIATARITRDFLQEQGLYWIKATVTNLDATNNLVITKEPFGTPDRIPPNSLGVIENEIHTFLDILPDPVTGNATMTLELVEGSELRRMGLLD